MLAQSAPKFDVNSFTDIAINMIPKNFLKTYTPLVPIIFSTLFRLANTKKTIIIFMNKPMMISAALNSARIDNNAVNVAGPASSGNTIGTIVADVLGESFLNTSTPKVISTEIMNMTIAPAIANDLTSTLKRFRSPSPTNRKAAIIKKATTAAFKALML